MQKAIGAWRCFLRCLLFFVKRQPRFFRVFSPRFFVSKKQKEKILAGFLTDCFATLMGAKPDYPLSVPDCGGGLARGSAPSNPGKTKTKGTMMAKRMRTHTQRFELRCSRDELSSWQRAAKEHGLPLAANVRACLKQGPLLSRASKADPALLRQIAAIGNNLNQIAFWCNAHKARQDTMQVEKGVAGVQAALENLLVDRGASC